VSEPRVSLLTERLVLRDRAGEEIDLGKQTAVKEFVCLLAVHAPKAAPYADLAAHGSAAKVHQDARRLRREGFALEGGFKTGYRLLLAPEEIDLWRVIRAAEAELSDVTFNQVEAALALLDRNGPCAELEAYPQVTSRVARAATELTRRRSVLRSRHVLIVDDQIGDELRALLRPHRCTVVTSLAEFLDLEDLLGFDLALIDLRLTENAGDRGGEAVLHTLKASGVRYPLILMTSQAWDDKNVTAYARLHGIDVITKGDKGTGRQIALRERVAEVFEQDDEATFRATVDQLPQVRKQAILRLRNRPDKVSAMHTEWSGLWLVADKGDVGRLRVAIESFLKAWG
jgi:DNA-binding IscR family transcriptional regulator